MCKPSIDLSIKSWELDYRLPPYRDCADGSFESDRRCNKGEILDCHICGEEYRVKVIASILINKKWRTYFDLI